LSKTLVLRSREGSLVSKTTIDSEITQSVRKIVADAVSLWAFETSDFSGLDTGLRVRQALTEVYGERFRPSQFRVNLVESGYLGRKTGRGFYRYDEK